MTLGNLACELVHYRPEDLCPIRAQIGFKVTGWHRLGVEVALQLLAFFRTQEGGLRRGFNALGDYLEPEVVRHYDDRAHNGRIFRRGLGGDLAHETLINLDAREWIARKIAQRRIAGAEIVEG